MTTFQTVPADAERPEMQSRGLDVFAAGLWIESIGGANDSPLEVSQLRAGWWTGWARCYGQGVKASMQATGETNPHEPGSPAAAAWDEGFRDEVYIDGGAG